MAIRNCEPARTCTFKRGDKVRCITAKNSDGMLVVGNVYTIQAGNSEGNSVSVEGIEGAFDYSRFELVKPSTKPSKIKAGRNIVTRPILFSGPMVRAILDGRKTQTRRYVKHQELIEFDEENGEFIFAHSRKCPNYCDYACGGLICPYGQVGQRLWVRETFCRSRNNTFYRCDGSNAKFKPNELSEEWDWDRGCGERWTPSIHMNRHHSRITLEITGVRIERLNEISEDDAYAEGALKIEADGTVTNLEGVNYYKLRSDESRSCFMQLWQSINGEGSWALNPWVWVVKFKRVTEAAS
jgi:hypothetical protein